MNNEQCEQFILCEQFVFLNRRTRQTLRTPRYTLAKGIVKSVEDAVSANLNPWNCDICPDSFPTLELCRQHVSVKHKGRKMCNRCPYIGKSSNMKKHEQSHAANGVNVKNPDCKLCHVQFANNGHLVKHLRRFHLPKDSK